MKLSPLFIALLLSSCGSSSDDSSPAPKCSSKIVGTWNGISSQDQVTLTGDEAFSYKGDDGCKTSGTFACPDPASTKASVKVTIKTADLSNNCLQAGDYTCAFELANEQFTFACGSSSARVYKK